MIGVGEKVRITDGWAEGQVAEVAVSDPRYLDLRMQDGSRMLFPLWRVMPLGQRDRVREATSRRFQQWKERGGAL